METVFFVDNDEPAAELSRAKRLHPRY